MSPSNVGNPPNPKASQHPYESQARTESERLKNQAGNVAGEAKAHASEAAEAANAQIHRATQKAMSSGRDYVASKKSQLAEEVGVLRDAIDQAAQTLDEKEHHGVATYVHAVAEQLDRFRDGLDKRSGSDMLHDAQDFTRRRPDIVYGTMFFAGLGLMRLLKASSDRRGNATDYSSARSKGLRHENGHSVRQNPSRSQTARPASPIVPRPTATPMAGPATGTITPNEGASLQPRTDFRHK